MKQILILGKNGQLGRELCQRAIQKEFEILAYDRSNLDLTDYSGVIHKIKGIDLSLVINAVAYTAVDKAEDEPDQAYAVNRDGPAILASICHEKGIPLIHISTDYVFDGSKDRPYLETDKIQPLGVYGKSKAAGEEEIRKQLKEHIIIRTSWLYGIHGNNFVKTMIRLGKERDKLRIVNDQFGCPTFAADLADAILSIAGIIQDNLKIKWGTYHYCGKDRVSWYEFAEKIFEVARTYENFRVNEIEPISTAEYPVPARRPANSVLDCSLLSKIYGITFFSLHDSLNKMLGKILK